MANYFGTDGIRGRAGEGKLSEASLERLAQAIGAHFGDGSLGVIGQDTRESGDWVRRALMRGLLRQGVNVASLGILPTPATAAAVPLHSAHFGLMITASHNPWQDNGVKLFGPDGRKISDAAQDAIETLIETAMSDGLDPALVPGRDHGSVEGAGAYVDGLVEAFQSTGVQSLAGLKLVVDAAHGAAFQAFPKALRKLGVEPVLIGVEPNGRNINLDCGSTHTEALSKSVIAHEADIGIALDGDADRLILMDRTGQEVDGDQIIARLATDWKNAGTLKSDAVVSTVMSNLGLERYLVQQGLRLDRTPVGDRHVAARMYELGANLGGEPSGHLLMTDYAVTGDGSLAALMILSGLVRSGQTSEHYLHLFDAYPQIMRNVRYSGASPMEQPEVQAAIRRVDADLGEGGRVLVRASGTEPKIRVMAEGEDQSLVSAAVDELVAVVEKAAL
ncbi:phosphoglucosamine mutase [Algimonas porphyrae]|uniref:Phosphoglucosamine mutase n=1 Tax=Algimonas porphyrae TaxID=1128113 RepID=A0ABQ5UXL1_9PROT|nr:phosphoglucosamine mutase [Algimonas porphyrae]GLQ20043.1 phosphoglucosamine mutase [Algimonas porphyrae]